MSNTNKQQQQQQQQNTAAKEAERKQETSKAASSALNAQREAKRLTQAAAATGDPDERQKLLNEALEREVEAENFGKTAKYLQSGAFQGLCAGAGIGGAPGVWLGLVTGTLVGGTTSLVTGGLGSLVGLGVGAAHGPWFKVGEWMGEGIRKVTGDIPGWKATEEQKKALEDMVNGVREQDRPGEEDLVQMTEDSGKIQAGKGFTGQREEDQKQQGLLSGAKPSMANVASSMAPPIPGFKSNRSEQQGQSKSKVQGQGAQPVRPETTANKQVSGMAGQSVTPSTGSADRPTNEGRAEQARAASQPVSERRNRPRKLQTRSVAPSSGSTAQTARSQSQQSAVPPSQPKKPPRKLEVRSVKATQSVSG